MGFEDLDKAASEQDDGSADGTATDDTGTSGTATDETDASGAGADDTSANEAGTGETTASDTETTTSKSASGAAVEATAVETESGDSGDEQNATGADQSDGAEAQTSEQNDPFETPAFPYEGSGMQTTIYTRPETRDELEETRKFTVEQLLHERGVDTNTVAKREHHDAIFQLAMDHPELWAEYVMEARGIDTDALDSD